MRDTDDHEKEPQQEPAAVEPGRMGRADWPMTTRAQRRRVNAMMALSAVALLALLSAVSGRIETNGGYGGDGLDYASMSRTLLESGNEHTLLRPVIPLLNYPAVRVTRDALLAYAAMDYLYAAALAWLCGLLFDHYSDDQAAKLLCVGNVLPCIAVLKLAGFYPVIIDLGAYAVLTWATWCIVSGRRGLTVVASVAAVLAREFGLAAIALGVVRDARQRVPYWKIAATYGPASILWIVWREHVAARFSGAITGSLIAHLHTWRDPQFVLFFGYFLLTVLGGVSMFVFAQPRQVLRHVWHEPEWAAYTAVIVAASAVGSSDIWRYQAYLLPAFVAAFATSARTGGVPLPRWWTAAAICVATLVTQRPLQHMDMATYLRDWFPYYLVGGTGESVWLVWTPRMAITGVLVVAIAALARWPRVAGLQQ